MSEDIPSQPPPPLPRQDSGELDALAETAYVARYGTAFTPLWRQTNESTKEAWRNVARAVLDARPPEMIPVPVADLSHKIRANAWSDGTPPAKERFVVDHGVLCEYVNHCTCGAGAGGYYGAHEPGCGLEPIAPVEQLVTVESTAEVLAGLREEMVALIGGDLSWGIYDAIALVEAAEQRLAEGRER